MYIASGLGGLDPSGHMCVTVLQVTWVYIGKVRIMIIASVILSNTAIIIPQQ